MALNLQGGFGNERVFQTLRQNKLDDQNTALVNERLAGERQAREFEAQDRAAAQQADAGRQQWLGQALALIDADETLSPTQKLAAKILLPQGKIPDFMQAAVKEERRRLQFAPNGQLVDIDDPTNAGKDFAKPEKADRPRIQIAPNGAVVNLDDPSILGKNFAAPREARTDNEPLVAIKDPTTGLPRLVPRSQAVNQAPASTRDQAMTEGQSNAAGFADRMKLNEKAIQGYESSAAASVGGRLASVLPRDLQSTERQSYDAAKKNWIAAQLRKESGAAISQGEYDEADRQYFPQPGDTTALITQKRELRKVAEASMRRAAGHGGQAASTDPDDLGKEW